ncbi:MAG: PIN domain-containing protein [Alphaproteobacteria bacterium]
MIGIDTNVLVRYLAQDDDTRSPIASQIVDGLTADAPGFVSIVVLVETVWVLSRAYKATREQVAETVELLLRARELVVEGAEAAYLALATYQSTNADFADALIAHGAKLAGCSETLTFDRAATAGTGMRMLGA